MEPKRWSTAPSVLPENQNFPFPAMPSPSKNSAGSSSVALTMSVPVKGIPSWEAAKPTLRVPLPPWLSVVSMTWSLYFTVPAYPPSMSSSGAAAEDGPTIRQPRARPTTIGRKPRRALMPMSFPFPCPPSPGTGPTPGGSVGAP